MERGKLSGKDDKYYKFTILSSGEVSIISKAQMYYIHYYIYDANGNQVWEKDFYKFELNLSKKLTFQMTSSQIKKFIIMFMIKMENKYGMAITMLIMQVE